MSEKLYRFEVDEKGIYEAVDLVCSREDSRREGKPDGSWLPKVGARFPQLISYWTEYGLWRYLHSGLYSWHMSVLDRPVKIFVASLDQEPIYSDEFQIIDDRDKFRVAQILSPDQLGRRVVVPYIKKPHYAVIFSSTRTSTNGEYEQTAERMMNLAKTQPGYLGFESARDTGQLGISVSYWDSLESIEVWKRNSEHLAAQACGKSQWYSSYTTRICKVERGYTLSSDFDLDFSPVDLRSNRIALQALSTCGAQQVLDYFVRNEHHFAPTDPPHPPGFHTLDFWIERIARSRVESLEGSSRRFVFRLPDERHRILGTVNLTQIFKGPFQACYLGYGIDHAYQGQGLMREALKLAIDYAFTELNLHRIMANHLVDNTRSSALLKKLGFQQEGVAKAYLYVAGEWRDHVLTSLTNPNWKNTL